MPRQRGRFLLGVILATGAVAGACSSFSEDDAPLTNTPDAEAGPAADGDPPLDAALDTNPPPSCIRQPIEPSDAGEDASCEPGMPPVVLQSSSKHCGRCGHDCLGTQCSNGRCEVIELTSGESSSPRIGEIFKGMLFYATSVGTGSDVRSVAIPVGTPTTLATTDGGSAMFAIAVEGSSVYGILPTEGVVSVPVTGGAATTVIPNTGVNFRSLASDATNLYVLDNAGAIKARPHSGAASFAIQNSASGSIDAFGSDGSRLYWTVTSVAVDGGPASTSTLYVRGPNAADSILQRATGLSAVSTLAFDAEYIYLTDGTSQVTRLTKAGMSAPEPVTRITGARRLTAGLTVDDDFVYIACNEYNKVGLDLYQAPKCGGPARLIAENVIYNFGLFSDDRHLYWSRDTSIARVVK
jgi:hypothetical protein